MAFSRANLRMIANDGVNRVWKYLSGSDSTATCDTAGYFSTGTTTADGRAGSALLKVNDIIEVTPSSGASGKLVVNANSRDLTAVPPVTGVVDTTSTTAYGSADSD